jgi:hypothetical protein
MNFCSYDADGKLKIKAENRSSLPKPEKLEFSLIGCDLVDAVEKAREDVMNVVDVSDKLDPDHLSSSF